jgi:translation initiation factor IF-1
MDVETLDGRIVEALPSTLFRVLGDNSKEYLSYLGGRMRVNKIKVLVGDRVTMELDPYGGKARIIKRL